VARYAKGWNPAGIPIDAVAQMFGAIQQMAAESGRNPAELELIVRGNIGLTDMRLSDDRPSFVGNLAQVIDDVRRCEEIGADGVVLDAQFSSAGATADAYAGFISDLAGHVMTVTA